MSIDYFVMLMIVITLIGCAIAAYPHLLVNKPNDEVKTRFENIGVTLMAIPSVISCVVTFVLMFMVWGV